VTLDGGRAIVGVTRRLAAVLAVAGLAACAAPERPGPAPVAAPTTTAPDGVRGATAAWEAGQIMAVRWLEGRRGLAVRASFPTTPSRRTVAAVQDLLVRIAQGLR
jgi:hypothetical protein